MQDRQTKHGRRKQIQYQAWEILPKRKIKQLPMTKGGTPEFKWQGWSNGGKNQNPKKSVGLQTKPQKIPGPKFNPPKIPCRISQPQKFPGSIKWHYTKNRNISFEYPKKSQKILAKIFLPQKFPNRKFQTPKLLRSSLSLVIRRRSRGIIRH